MFCWTDGHQSAATSTDSQFSCIGPLYSEVGLLKILHMNPIETGFFYSCISLVEVPQEVPQELQFPREVPQEVQVTTSDSSHLFPSADCETPAASPTF